MLIERHAWPPKEYHYLFRRGGEDDVALAGAVEYLARQGCSKVIHVAGSLDSDTQPVSYGIIEPVEVVRARNLEPRYD